MNIKAMKEKRNSLYNNAQEIFNAAAEAGRDLTSDEKSKFDGICNQIEQMDSMIEKATALQRSHEHRDEIDRLEVDDFEPGSGKNINAVKQFAADARDLANYLRAKIKGEPFVATATNLSFGDNGAIIKTTIMDKILEKVEEITPLYKLANHYNIAGYIGIPEEDETTDSVTIALSTEFQEVESHASELGSVDLNPQSYAALIKVSRKLIASSDFDLINWLCGKIAKKLAVWYDILAFNGKTKQQSGNTVVVIKGIPYSYDSTNMKVTLAAKDDISVDEIIDLQELIPDLYQDGAFFVMNRLTRRLLRKKKDQQGRYLLVNDQNSRFGKTLQEADVYTTSAVTTLGDNDKMVLFYLNPEGLAIQEPPTKEIQVLNELYANQDAVGIRLRGDIDIQVENKQMVAVAVTPAAAAASNPS